MGSFAVRDSSIHPVTQAKNTLEQPGLPLFFLLHPLADLSADAADFRANQAEQLMVAVISVTSTRLPDPVSGCNNCRQALPAYPPSGTFALCHSLALCCYDKQHDQKQLREENVYLAAISTPWSVIQGSQSWSSFLITQPCSLIKSKITCLQATHTELGPPISTI